MNNVILTKMQEYQAKVKRILPGGIHYNFRLPWEESPIHFVKAKNSTLWDIDGKQYLDFYARFGAAIIGHNNEEYNENLKAMIDRILSVSHCDIDAEILELITEHIPSADMVRFGVSGTEVIQNALRLARAWTGKNRFVRFEGHYHGNADNIMGGKASAKTDFIPQDFTGDFKGTAGRAQGSLENQSYLLPWNDADVLEDFLRKKANDIAAVIMEPVCVNAGSIMPSPGYLQKVRKLCNDYQIVLIFDEVITGFRMGLGGAQQFFNVTPDITILGKALAGGAVPVAAMVGKKEIMQLLVDKKVIHAGTFNGYPLGAAAVKTTLEILSRNNSEPLIQMNQKMNIIHGILKKQADVVGLPMVIQGPTSCASYHCTEVALTNPADFTYELMFLNIVLNTNLAKNGILVSTFSRLYPNISLDFNDIEWFRENVNDALLKTKEVYDELVITD